MNLFQLKRRYTTRKFAFLLLLLLTLFETGEVLRCQPRRTYEPVSRSPEKIYIASQHWNNAELLRSRWNDAVVALARTLGQDNVFVAIHESGSWDDSKGALREPDTMLGRHGIRRDITMSNVTHVDEMSTVDDKGWVVTSGGGGNADGSRIYLSSAKRP